MSYNLFKRVCLISVFMIHSTYADCKFPQPCGKTFKAHEVIVKSRIATDRLTSGEYSSNSVNWAWEKLYNQVGYGGKRLNTELPEGVPFGEVFISDRGIEVQSSDFIISYDLYENQKKIWSIQNSRIFIIPKKLFKPGQMYTWSGTFKNMGDMYSIKEDFNVIETKRSQIVEQDRAKIFKEIVDTEAATFIFAVYCFEYGYDYNGNMLIEKLNKGNN